jgi:hypothetical protein
MRYAMKAKKINCQKERAKIEPGVSENRKNKTEKLFEEICCCYFVLLISLRLKKKLQMSIQ